MDLGPGEGARFALERHLLQLGPGEGVLQANDQPEKLLGTDERGRPAAEIDEPEGPAQGGRLRRIELDLAPQGVQIPFDFLAVLVGIDPEIAELAAFPAEGNVEVEPEAVRSGARGPVEGFVERGKVVRTPARVRRVVGDEDVAEIGFRGWLGHVSGPLIRGSPPRVAVLAGPAGESDSTGAGVQGRSGRGGGQWLSGGSA